MDNIEAINIVFENGDKIHLEDYELKDFCISNLDQNGEEIPYEQTFISNKLYANFFMLKLNNKITESNKLKRIKQKNDIVEIILIFKNNKYLKFDIASNADPFATNYHNDYEYIYETDESLGILLSKYKIKYKENLFV